MAVNINIPSEVTQTITDGVTTTAPSENAVFDALALKANSADLALVATTGDYNDLDNLPIIPDVSTLVPYTGATQNVDLGEFELKSGQVEFDQTPTGTAGVAVMRWNNTDGTVDLGLKGGNVTLQVGQEQVLRVVNKTATNINLLEANYQAVRVTGAQGQRLKIDLALATNDLLSAETIGLVTETINNNQEGFITTSGLVRGINTTGSLQTETWADGDVLYLSPTTAGNVTKVKPTAPNHLVIVGYVVSAHITQGSIFVKVDNGYELDELHNVLITSVADNNLLQYDSATSLWKNESLSTAGIQPTLTSGTNIKTINGNTLLGSGDLVISGGGGITVGTTAVTSGTVGRVFFQGTGNVVQQDSALFYDNTNKRLGLGANGNTPTSTLFVRTNTTTAHDTFILQNGQYGNPIFRVRDNATASQSTIGSLFVAARIYGSNSTTTGNELDLGGYGLGSSYGAAATNAVWLNNQGNVGDGAGNSIISVTSNIFFNLQTTKKIKFEGQTGHFGIGQVGTLGARLDIKAQGALSSDFALRVRNSVDSSNLFVVKGNGVLNAANLPTSSAGLVSGDIWNNLGILTIV